jgi:hypothetical protein
MKHWTRINEFNLDFIDVDAVSQFKTLVMKSGINPVSFNIQCNAPEFSHQKCASWVMQADGTDQNDNTVRVIAWVEWSSKGKIEVTEHDIQLQRYDLQREERLWVGTSMSLKLK